MDHSELIKRIKEYESKWGQLGHTNIMKPEKTTISHSGTETNGGKDKMTDMKNDFLEFRKKVYNGNKANKIAHTSTVNVKDLNERYFEEVTSNGTLIHAQSPLYGEQRDNTKYYKREGEPGKYKYYYTKEEWDAAHNKSDNSKEEESGGKVAGTIDPRDGKMIKYTENGPVKMNTTFEQYRQGAQMEADRKIERTAKESGLKAGINALLKDERMEEFFTQFEGGFENHGWTLNYDGSISGMTPEDEQYVKSMQDWAKKFKDSTGVDIYGSKEFQDAVTKEIQNRWEKVEKMKSDPDYEKKKAEEEAKWEKQAEEDGKKMNEAIEKVHAEEDAKAAEKNKIAEDPTVKKYIDKAENESPAKIAKQIYKNRDFGLKELFKEVKGGMIDGAMKFENGSLMSNGDDNKFKEYKGYKDEIEAALRPYVDAIAKGTGAKGAEILAELKRLVDAKFTRLSNKYAKKTTKHNAVEAVGNSKKQDIKNNTDAEKVTVKKRKRDDVEHSAIEGEEEMNINKVQSTVNGEEILDEYRAFKERANRGARMNQLSHSAIISPEELNARYEEEIRNNSILIHAKQGPSNVTNKYYAKIDLPGGKVRYFYTKAEWDGYQRNKQGSSKAGEDRAKKNNPAIEEKKKEWYKKAEDAAKAGNGDKGRFLSNWQRDMKTYSDTETSMREGGGDYSEPINDFLRDINGDRYNIFDTTARDNLNEAVYNGKDSKGYKNMVSRMKKANDLYDRDLDKFEKLVREEEGNSEAEKILKEAEDIHKKSLETYKEVTDDYDKWRETKIKQDFGGMLKDGLTNANDLATFREFGYDVDKFSKWAKEKWNEFGYDEFAQDILMDILKESCKITLERLR